MVQLLDRDQYGNRRNPRADLLSFIAFGITFVLLLGIILVPERFFYEAWLTMLILGLASSLIGTIFGIINWRSLSVTGKSALVGNLIFLLILCIATASLIFF